MVPPSTTHGTITAAIQKGDLLTVVTVAAIGGQKFVTVGVPSRHLPHTAVWIKFEEVGGTGFPNTAWLTGGSPGIGGSHFGLTSTHKDPTSYGGTSTYNLWLPMPYFIFSDMSGGNAYVGSNITIGLNGYVPGPVGDWRPRPRRAARAPPEARDCVGMRVEPCLPPGGRSRRAARRRRRRHRHGPAHPPGRLGPMPALLIVL